MKFTVHCVVKNEDKWVWFALQSVLPFADKILVFDTGSTDKTIELIKSIKSDKIVLEEKGAVDRKGLVKLRQEQLNRTKTDWFLILDGDEVWKKDELEKLLNYAEKNQDKIAFINKTRNCLGDVYHYQSDSAGNYRIGKYKGNLNIRLIKKIKGLSLVGEYPLEYYADNNGSIQKQEERIEFVDCWCLHTTYLKRSSDDKSKTSGSLGKSKVWEKGDKMSDTDLPETLFIERPAIVDNPLTKRGIFYDFVTTITDPFVKLKRSTR